MKKLGRTRGRDSPVVEVFFMLGAILIVVGFLYSVARHWPSFDPLALAMLVGMGLAHGQSHLHAGGHWLPSRSRVRANTSRPSGAPGADFAHAGRGRGYGEGASQITPVLPSSLRAPRARGLHGSEPSDGASKVG